MREKSDYTVQLTNASTALPVRSTFMSTWAWWRWRKS